jgi:AraC family transcriptional regulator of adaptative response/methylated-DNA-[protein]-cysteine methyltransferase
MEEQQKINYERIEAAISYIKENFKSQPSLEEVSQQIHVSPHHFQRMFTQWAGTSPKKFLQYISVEYAKKLLKEENISLFDTAIGSTNKGICHLAFTDDETAALNFLKNKFPNAHFKKISDLFQQNALAIFNCDWKNLNSIKLHLKGTNFQIKVWETLLKIPTGRLTTYGKIANQIEKPKASRAVGTAIGANPVAFLIPCHRVIQSSGIFGGYHWGSTRKVAIIGWEAATVNEKNF